MLNKQRRNLVFLSSLSVYALSVPVSAAAQAQADLPAGQADPAVTPPARSGGVEEIVVTAQRRQESLQQVPISITALTADSLDRAGIGQTSALQAATPGLQLPTNRNAVQPYIRGVGSQNVSPGDEGSSAIYVDGVLYSVSGANVFSLNNIERVEVLKGPQGTLFGRNAVGGLINIITRNPDGPTLVKGSFGYESYDTITGSFYAGGRLSSGIAADISIHGTKQNDGWGINRNLGVDVNLNKEISVRSKLVFDLGEHTDLTLSGDFSDNRSDIGQTRQALPGTRVTTGLAPVGTIYDTTGNLLPFGKRRQYGGSAKFTHEMDWATFTSTTAYRNYNLNALFDQDGSSARVLEFRPPEVTSTFQQELLLTGDVGRLEWTSGVFYFFSDAQFKNFAVSSALAPAQNTVVNSKMLTNSYAIFGQGTYGLTDTTKLTLGLRYTYDTREISGTRVAGLGHPSPVGTLLNTTATLPRSQTNPNFDKLTWRVALDQQLTQGVLAFASVSRGFKSGVFNTNSPTTPAVLPETLDAYEVGIKSDLFDRTLRVNLSAFYSTYDNIQLTANFLGSPTLINAAAGRIKGLELDTTFAPRLATGNLEIRGALSILDATYSRFPGGPGFAPRPAPAGGNIQTFGDFKGNDFQSAPRFTSTLTVNYDLPIGDNTLGASVTWYHNDGFFWDPENRVRQNAYDLISAQLSFALPDDRWRLRGYVRNLANEKYYSFVSVSTTGDLGVPAAPRVYGVAVDFKF